MKVKSAIIASLFLTSIVFADNYVFTGAVSGELTDYQNYIKVDATPSIWGTPFVADGSGVATSLPTELDNVGIGAYKYSYEEKRHEVTPNMTISSDFTVKKMNVMYNCPGNYYPTITIGSADQDVTFSVTGKDDNWVNIQAGFLAGSYAERTLILKRAAEAVDTSVVIDIAIFTMARDDYEIGTVDTGAIDVLSFDYLTFWYGNVSLKTFANKIEVLGGIKLNQDHKTGDVHTWNIIVSDKAFDNGTYINVLGSVEKIEEQKITFDFSQIELEEGMVYDLMTVEGEKTGFHDDALADFEFFNTGDIDYSVAWNGNTLQLTTAVPEASEVAAVLGIAALAFAYIRRRK